MAVAPGHAHMPAIKILHLDKILALRQLVPRHCASARHQLCKRGQICGSDQTCTATLVMLNKTCTWTAKSAPCFVHSGWYQDSTPMTQNCSSLHSLSNTTSLYCRAVIANVQHNRQLATVMTTLLDTATTYLAHLLLRDTRPTAHAKAKEPNFSDPGS
jgi:hypothetical protein